MRGRVIVHGDYGSIERERSAQPQRYAILDLYVIARFERDVVEPSLLDLRTRHIRFAVLAQRQDRTEYKTSWDRRPRLPHDQLARP